MSHPGRVARPGLPLPAQIPLFPIPGKAAVLPGTTRSHTSYAKNRSVARELHVLPHSSRTVILAPNRRLA